MARRKKHPEINRLEGNPGRRPFEEFESIDALGEPFIPEHLSDDARGCIEIVKANMPVGVYSAVDSYLLAAFGTAWALHKLAAHKMNDPEFKFVEKSKRGSGVESPWLKIAKQQASLMASLGDRLGLDPKSRAALKLPGAKPKSRFAGLLGINQQAKSNLKN